MYTVRASDLYVGYHFKVLGAMKNGEIKQIPPERITWTCLGTIQVDGGVVTYVGEKGDKLIAQVFNKQKKIVATDFVYITDDDDQYEDWEFGVSGLDKEDDSQLIRTRDATNKDYFIDLSTGRVLTDFDGIFDFVRVKDAENNEFVKIPTLYRKRTTSELVISKFKKDETFEVYPCFINPFDGEIMEEIAIGCYKGGIKDNVLISQSNVDRKTETLEDWNMKIKGSNKYNYYFLKNIEIHELLSDLFVVVFCSRSVDNVFKQYQGVNPLHTKTGITDIIYDNAFSYPKNCCGYNFSNKSFKFFGIEDPFDGGVEWLEGIENISELTTSEETTMFYYGTTYNKEEKREMIKNYIKINFNNANIKSLKSFNIGKKTLVIEKDATQDVKNYYNNSVFHMGVSDGSCDIINGIPLYINSCNRTGIWTKCSVPSETKAYSRLCYCEKESFVL